MIYILFMFYYFFFFTKFTILKLIFKRICNRLLIEYFYEISLKAFSDNLNIQFISVQSLSRVQLFATPWIAAYQAFLSITISRSSFKFTSTESVMPSSHLILCRPLLLLPPIPPSIRVFSNESTLHMRWPKYCSFSLSIIPSKEHPTLDPSFFFFGFNWLSFLPQVAIFFVLCMADDFLLHSWCHLSIILENTGFHLNILFLQIVHLFLLYWLCQSHWLCGSQ